MTIYDYIANILPANKEYYSLAKKKFDSIAKPIDSFGKGEDIICKIASINESLNIDVSKKAVVVFCSDNGIVEEGVSQVGQDVTLTVFDNINKGTSCINRIASHSGACVFAVDSGIRRQGFKGTDNFTKGPAMSREPCEKAILAGILKAEELKNKGFNLVAAGEMGIGNTTTSSAVCSCLLNLEPKIVSGRGAGLSDKGLKKKIDAICKGIDLNKPDINDPIDVISKVGGLDIASMTGFYLGCAFYKIPCVIDGFIALVSALCAVMLNSFTLDFLIFSHKSSEAGCEVILKYLKASPILDGDFHQGEGTGAALLFPMIDIFTDIFLNQESFADIEMKPYERFGES